MAKKKAAAKSEAMDPTPADLARLLDLVELKRSATTKARGEYNDALRALQDYLNEHGESPIEE